MYTINAWKLTIYLLFYVHILQRAKALMTPMIGPPGKIEVLSLEECPAKPDSDLAKTYIAETELKDVDGAKLVSAKVTLPEDFDDSYFFHIRVNVFNGERYFPVLPLRGVVVNAVKAYIPDLWEKVATAANMSPDFPVPAGTYELNDFDTDVREIAWPRVFYGKVRLDVTIFKEKEAIFCRQLEIESTPPEK